MQRGLQSAHKRFCESMLTKAAATRSMQGLGRLGQPSGAPTRVGTASRRG